MEKGVVSGCGLFLVRVVVKMFLELGVVLKLLVF